MRRNSRFSASAFKPFLKLFYPGMKIKRWIFLSALGMVVIALSSALLFTDVVSMHVALINLTIGIALVVAGMSSMFRSVFAVFVPGGKDEIINALYQKRQLERGPKIVTVGGGTGLSVLLKGLKEYTANITAIVTVADSGGSSGRLREQYDVLPPGDIRNCLVALADAEPLMSDLFQFRFDKDTELGGHSFGNLFITAMTKLTGDFELAIKESSKVLAIRGQVIPSTLESVSLVAEYVDGSQVKGEAQIPEAHGLIKRVFLEPQNPAATKEALKAIAEADAIVLGPGSLYTSIIPNLLIREITDTICRSQMPKIYICNVMTQPGETDTYSAFDHVRVLIAHARPDIINTCVINIADVPQEFLKKYEEDGAFPVIDDSQRIRDLGYRLVGADLIGLTDFIRHDPGKLSKVIFDTIMESKTKKNHG